MMEDIPWKNNTAMDINDWQTISLCFMKEKQCKQFIGLQTKSSAL
jgi:hypothetical protein